MSKRLSYFGLSNLGGVVVVMVSDPGVQSEALPGHGPSAAKYS
jgi:hypothetical protein